jgi:hypothetical protein
LFLLGWLLVWLLPALPHPDGSVPVLLVVILLAGPGRQVPSVGMRRG